MISIAALLICLIFPVTIWIGGHDRSLAIGLVTFLLTVPYFIPAFVADAREHHNRAAIFALNLLLGWTGIGWIIALIWSLTRRAS